MATARQLELAEFGVEVLDLLRHTPDGRPVFTGWIACRLGVGVDGAYSPPQWLRHLLARLQRQGLVERATEAWCQPGPYWRLTAFGWRWDGSVADLARPIRREA